MNEALTHTPTTTAFASLCKALGDEMRVEILRVLATNSYGVMELAEIFDVTQPRMSHHLKVLSNVGLVTTRREGSAIFYRRAQSTPQDPFMAFTQSAFDEGIDRCQNSEAVASGVTRIHQARAESSAQFFVENAAKFRAKQDLIASYSVYGHAVTEFLDNSPLERWERALEVGPGGGEFLNELHRRFETVVALDNSQSMLDQAIAYCQSEGLTRVQFRQGDAALLPEKSYYDCIVTNMVLHHTPSPADIFRAMSGALRTGGVIIVTELCAHDQHWVHDACGDVWLGFDPNDIDRWAYDAKLTPGQSQFLALRNGFQIQLKQFIKP